MIHSRCYCIIVLQCISLAGIALIVEILSKRNCLTVESEEINFIQSKIQIIKELQHHQESQLHNEEIENNENNYNTAFMLIFVNVLIHFRIINFKM